VSLRVRWFLSVLVAVVVLVVVVRFVRTHNSDAPASQTPTGLARADAESTVVVKQDQAPHVAKLKPGLSPAAGITRAVKADIASSVNQGFINGPIEHAGCRPLGPHAQTVRFNCLVEAANIAYPFLGVVDVSAHRITYCKKDQPPVPSQNIPVSQRCTS
jgi:hypothetical protein